MANETNKWKKNMSLKKLTNLMGSVGRRAGGAYLCLSWMRWRPSLILNIWMMTFVGKIHARTHVSNRMFIFYLFVRIKLTKCIQIITLVYLLNKNSNIILFFVCPAYICIYNFITSADMITESLWQLADCCKSKVNHCSQLIATL